MGLYSSDVWKSVPFESLRGLTIEWVSGLVDGSEEVVLLASGRVYRMLHQRECCEEVSLVDTEGDASDLVGQVILVAEKTESRPSDHEQWTFFRLRTVVGTVVLRWYGESNGYYSEDVDILTAKDPLELDTPRVGPTLPESRDQEARRLMIARNHALLGQPAVLDYAHGEQDPGGPDGYR